MSVTFTAFRGLKGDEPTKHELRSLLARFKADLKKASSRLSMREIDDGTVRVEVIDSPQKDKDE